MLLSSGSALGSGSGGKRGTGVLQGKHRDRAKAMIFLGSKPSASFCDIPRQPRHLSIGGVSGVFDCSAACLVDHVMHMLAAELGGGRQHYDFPHDQAIGEVRIGAHPLFVNRQPHPACSGHWRMRKRSRPIWRPQG